MPTIKDVAKEAGVGIGTVSRVTNQSGYVKEETRLKIEEAIKKLGYKSNEIARSMIKQKNGIVAFIIPNSYHLFFGELLQFVEEELYKYGYKLMLCNSSQEIKKELAYLEMLENNRVDACILITNNDIEMYLRKDLPIISFDRVYKDIPYVTSDNYRGGELAAEHLIKMGCNHLMYIGDDTQGVNTNILSEVTKRRDGFIDYAKKHGIKNIVNLVYPLGDYIEIPNFVNKGIDQHPEVDGIFCISDAVAATVILELEKIGRKVPEEVRVIGFDGGRSFINLGKSITSISQNIQEIAKSIGEMIEAYYRKEKIENKIIDVEINLGDSA